MTQVKTEIMKRAGKGMECVEKSHNFIEVLDFLQLYYVTKITHVSLFDLCLHIHACLGGNEEGSGGSVQECISLHRNVTLFHLHTEQ